MEEIELRPKDATIDCIAWALYTQEIHSYFASNRKFVTSLNKVLLVIFLLLFIHSFEVASDFSVNPTKPYLKKFLYIFRALEIF